jgi:hypothetical protein
MSGQFDQKRSEEEASREFEEAYDFDRSDPLFGLEKSELRGPKLSRRTVLRLLAAAGTLSMTDVLLSACGAATPAAPVEQAEQG